MKKIIWTRSFEDWQQDQTILHPPKGVELISLPLLRFEPLPVNLADKAPKFVIVTSQKTTHFIAARAHWLDFFRKAGSCFLTFGSKTYQSLLDLKLTAKHLTATGGQSFAEKMIQQFPASDAWFLAADRPAVRVDEILKKNGWQAEFIALYRSLPITELDAKNKNLLQESISDLVLCFASPFAVEGFASLAERHQWKDWQKITVAAIGATTAASCAKYWSKVATAEEASVESLFKLALQQINNEI